MPTTPDRRICPVCQKAIATREVGGTNQLVLREHDGTMKQVRGTSMLWSGNRKAVSGECLGALQPVERLVDVWRARGGWSRPCRDEVSERERVGLVYFRA